jgi:hypothetical protein
VEPGAHLVRRLDPHVARQYGVERAAERGRRPPRGHAHAGGLAARVHAGVGAAGARDRHGRPAQALQRRLEVALHGADVALALPAGEAGTVVVQHELHGPGVGVHRAVT